MCTKKERLAALCRARGIQILYAFGSRDMEAREMLAGRCDALNASGSDLDIGVKMAGTRSLTIKEKASFALELEELFGVSRVDLVVLAEADPFLAANIIRGERLFRTDENSADEYDLYILRRAGDLAPLERERLSLIEQR
jgi:predicted nucleotidyltransferase